MTLLKMATECIALGAREVQKLIKKKYKWRDIIQIQWRWILYWLMQWIAEITDMKTSFL